MYVFNGQKSPGLAVRIHRIKSKIKRLYKEYDQHLDRITELDNLLNNESIEAQQCFKEIKKYAYYLNIFNSRGKVFRLNSEPVRPFKI